MASWLDEYRQIKVDMESAFNGSAPGVEQLIVYQELIYRIGVLETAKALCGSAHATTDTQAACTALPARGRVPQVRCKRETIRPPCRCKAQGAPPDRV